MNLLGCIRKLRVERHILLLLVVMASTDCATTQVPFAEVESVVKGNRLAAGAELQGVQIKRGDTSLTTATGMSLQKGDWIVTNGTTEAVILFSDAYEVILSPATEISISPDIFLNFGKVIVKKLKEMREKFRVETKYVNAGVEHTEFAVSVDRGDVVSVVVLEGTVILESRTQNWAPQTIGAREVTTVRAGQLPSRRERLTQNELDRTFGWARRVEAIALPAVPDLIGLSLDQARTQLSRAGLQVGRIRQVAGEPLGTVLRQSRRAGERVRLGTRVDLDVAGESTVPDVRGMSSLEAGFALALAGLQAGETFEEEDTGARPGKVARQSPPPGTRVPPGTAVSLVIASRQLREPSKPSERREPGENLCTVPDIRHVSVERAPGVLRERHLQLGSVRKVEGRSAGVTQNPLPGARVRCGSSVDLVIYSVPSGSDTGPSDKTHPTVCTVPDILSGGPRNARRILGAAGLRLGEVEQRIEGPPYQNPKAGAHVACGSSVNVSW